MKIIYIVFARMPTEKAHGFTIAKSCEAFARAGADVTLLIPKRATPFTDDLFTVYGLERNFRVVELNVPDLTDRFGFSKGIFLLQYFLFYIAVKWHLLFASRDVVLYTREAFFTLLAWLGFRVVLECHLISRRRTSYIAHARRAFRIIVISRALKDALAAAGIKEQKVFVAPSGVDMRVFDTVLSKEDARRELAIPEDTKVVLYTGNFTTMGEDKGIADIIRALKDAPGVTAIAVGGSEQDIAHYRMQAEEAGVSERTKLLPYAPQPTLARYQKAADILLMPFPDTPHYRNHMSPVKMFEYMAAERPIIASDLPTIREVLSDENARIVPPGNPAALAQAMQDMLAHPLEAAALAARAKHDVERYSWEERTKRILDFIGNSTATAN